MFQFLQPIWLSAITAIAIPIIIHWWNNRQRKTLLVGSIAFLASNTKQRVQNRRISDWLLLVLRCLMILLLALLLAQPVWKNVNARNPEKGWLLMERQTLQQNYSQHKRLIDSLTQAGYVFCYFEPGLQKTTLKEALEQKNDTAIVPAISYRSLFVAADQKAPAGLPLYIFTGNRLQQFTGVQPATARTVQWHTAPAADSVNNWISQAFLTARDSIRVIAGNSNAAQTRYNTLQVAKAPGTEGDLNTGLQDGKLVVSMGNDAPVMVDTATLLITVFTDRYVNDSRYCKAAIEAVQQYSGRKIQLTIANNIAAVPAHQQWLFWLSEQAIPVKYSADKIFRYDTGKVENTQSWLQAAGIGGSPIAVYKRIQVEPSLKSTAVIWQDAFGNPLLISEKREQQQVFHFYDRFDPAWSDLPWSEHFPLLMMQLLLPGQRGNDERFDRRSIAEEQVQPRIADNTDVKENTVIAETKELSGVFWLLLFVLFVAERILSFAQPKNKVNG
ncbi:MAG: BatA domain-containing protein [Chitinophagaceae bacterium]